MWYTDQDNLRRVVGCSSMWSNIPVFKPERKINKLITALNFGKFSDQYSGDFWKIQAEEVKRFVFKKSKRLFKSKIIIL